MSHRGHVVQRSVITPVGSVPNDLLHAGVFNNIDAVFDDLVRAYRLIEMSHLRMVPTSKLEC